MILQNSNQSNSNQSITSEPQEKLKGLKVTDNISEISKQRIDQVPFSVINPNNNAAFEEKSNPLSSKGN